MASSQSCCVFLQDNQSIATEEERKNVYLINYGLDYNGVSGDPNTKVTSKKENLLL